MKLWVKILLWVLFAGSIITLLVYVEQYDSSQEINKPTIKIHMEGNDPFLTEDVILKRLDMAGLTFEGQKNEELDVAAIEKFMRSISQVKDVEVYRNFSGNWTIDVSLRKAIARIYNKQGESFYLDSDGETMSITPVHTAHVLIITGDIKDRKGGENVSEIINNDSLISIKKLDDIYRISNYVCKDTLFRSLIGQVHLEKNGDFVLVPIVGDQKIIFGSAYTEKEVSEKFGKLKIFYKEAMPFEGWDKYSEISLKFKDQIVCKTVEQQQ